MDHLPTWQNVSREIDGRRMVDPQSLVDDCREVWQALRARDGDVYIAFES